MREIYIPTHQAVLFLNNALEIAVCTNGDTGRMVAWTVQEQFLRQIRETEGPELIQE